MTRKRILQTVSALTLIAVCALIYCFWAASQHKTDSTGYPTDPVTEYLVTQYADASGQQGTFYTITAEDTLIVIDGGWAENADAVRKVIKKYGGTVNAWIISHPHRDHAGAFNQICADPDGITVEQIYDNGFDYDFIESVGEPYDDITVMEAYYELTKDAPNVTHLKRGDVFSVRGLTFSVLNAYDDMVLNNVGGEKDYQNNASLLLRADSAHSSMLFCSDIKYDMDGVLLSEYGDAVSCDYVQTGHHGNWSFSEEFYRATDASVFFFDAPSEITDNPDFPACALKEHFQAEGKAVFTFDTAPNSVTLK